MSNTNEIDASKTENTSSKSRQSEELKGRQIDEQTERKRGRKETGEDIYREAHRPLEGQTLTDGRDRHQLVQIDLNRQG